MENLGSATGSETGYKHTVKGYESPPAEKGAKVDGNEITVNGYESREPVSVVKVEPKKKGQGKKRGAAAGAVGRVPRAEKRAKVGENEITVNGYESREPVVIVKVEPKKKGRGKKRGETDGADVPVPPAKKRVQKRAKCDHGRDKRFCRECGGNDFCPHGRQKHLCKECGGSNICPHGRQRHYCRECGGSSICVHGKRKDRCKECNGAAIGNVEGRAAKKKGPKKRGATDGAVVPVPPAEKRVQKRAKCDHGRQRQYCRECGGSSICVHGKRKNRCKECNGAAIWAKCAHGINKSSCRFCGSGYCHHGRERNVCKPCGGSQICAHGRRRCFCKECGGSQICPHNKRKSACRDCKLAKQAKGATAATARKAICPGDALSAAQRRA